MTQDNTVVAPTERKKKEILAKMPEVLREVALAIDHKICVEAEAHVTIRYDIGTMIAGVIEQDKTYGAGAVEQLAAYRGEKATTLYALADFSKSFDREYVRQWTRKPMADGNSYLTEKHWNVIRQLPKRADQEKYLKKAIDKSLSANDLQNELRATGAAKNVRSGGRKASAPMTPLGGLQKFGSLALAVGNYEEQQMESAVFSIIDEMSPDSVSEVLFERLKHTKTACTNAIARLELAETRIEANLSRIEAILKDKAERAAEESVNDRENPVDEENEESGSETGNGKADKPKAKKPVKKTKKKKKNKPAAATN